MSEIIYFDNSATTAVSAAVAQTMYTVMRENFGNPSSVHIKGIEADKILKEARINILKALGERNPIQEQLIFTASGTESDNLAISGVMNYKSFSFTPRIITTDSEHPAVSEPIKFAEARGAEVVRLSTHGGIIDMDELKDALTPNTVLVSIMLANNETGAVYDVANAFRTVKELSPDTLTHCDAVQGFMKIPINVQKLGADLLTVSAHKINGPKGIGALYINHSLAIKKKLSPVILGGGQEHGMRSGTENLPGIAGFSCAVNEKKNSMAERAEKVTKLRNQIINSLPEEIKVNVPRGRYLPNIISITLPKIKSEVMLRYLSQYNICVSSGSACSAKHKNISPSLTAFGLDASAADSTLRISISSDNTSDEAEKFIQILNDGLNRLVRMR